MKKNYLYTVLGLIGIMGTLSIGVARAVEVSEPYGTINYTLNGDEPFTAQAITITGDDGSVITILDRNLGATAAGIGCEGSSCSANDPTYGYYFQWGNNYGFYPNNIPSSTNVKVSSITYDPSNQQYYSSSIFIYGSSNWLNDNSKVDLWGGSIDDYEYNLNDDTWQVKNSTYKRGPCPENFHVPTKGELDKVKSMMGNNVSNIHTQLKIPYAGNIGCYDKSVSDLGERALLWSSVTNSTTYSDSCRLGLSPGDSISGPVNLAHSSRANAHSVRCFYDEYDVYAVKNKVKFDVNGGDSVTTGSVKIESGATLNLSLYTGTKDGWEFVGWNTNSGATEAISDNYTAYPITEDITLYAIFRKIPQPIKITYDPNEGAFSGKAVGETIVVTYNTGTYTPDINIQFPNKESDNMAAQSGWMFDGWYTTSVFADQTSATEWTGFVDENTESQTVYAKWLEFNDLYLDFGNTRFIIMDRNLGASEIYDGTPTDSNKGKFYQWGNNYGFDNKTSPWKYLKTSQAVNNTDDPWGPGNYYSSATFIKLADRWDEANNKNLWGGTGDTVDADGEGTTQEGRQGPCPKGWHVPSYIEWKNLKNAFNIWKDSEEGTGFCSQYEKVTNCLANKLKLPNAGYRLSNYSNITDVSHGIYWSSSPYYNISDAYYFDNNIGYNGTYNMNSNRRACGSSVRCFKDSPTHTLTFNATENGASTTSQSSVEATQGSSVTLPSCNETKTGFTCIGWNTDATAHEGLASITLNEDKTVYAIFKKDLTATYTATNASISGNQTSGSCTLWNKDTSCSMTLPSITCNAGYHTPAWTPENLDNVASDTGATASCTACGNGTYTEAGNIATSCTACTAIANSDGRTSAGTSADTCGFTCSAGYKYDGTSRTCTACEAGKYTEAGNTATSCTTCEAGYYCSGGTKTACPTGYTSDAGASAQNGCYKVLTATFNTNGATSVSSGSVTCKLNYGSSTCDITSPSITPADGFDALGFNTDNTAETSILAVNTSTSISTDIIYHAITKSSSTSKVTFDINGNGGSTSTGECYRYNGSGSCLITAPAITPAAEFTVIGWNSNKDTHTNEWTGGDLKTVSVDATYYAQSSKAGYQVTASYNIGTGVSEIGATSGQCNVEMVYNGSGYSPCNIILPTITLKDGYGTGIWSTGAITKNPGDPISLLADDTYTASATPNTYVVTYEVNGGDALTPNTGSVSYELPYGTLPTPNRNGYSFNGWFTAATSGNQITGGTVVSTIGDHTLYAQWTQNPVSGGGYSGGGGGSSSSTDKTAIDTVKESVDSSMNNSTDRKETAVDGNEGTVDSSNSETSEPKYSEEFQNAYTFAREKSITTMNTIEEADMEGGLTRIAMAKMLSYYAINVLGKKPDTARKIKFRDISSKLDKQYDNGVTLAYQLGIMGINMKNNRFRPNDYVTRAEFGTALSRMLYGLADGKKNYYSTHLQKLMEKKIITNDNPNLRELRGYVMIMLMRSTEEK